MVWQSDCFIFWPEENGKVSKLSFCSRPRWFYHIVETPRFIDMSLVKALHLEIEGDKESLGNQEVLDLWLKPNTFEDDGRLSQSKFGL